MLENRINGNRGYKSGNWKVQSNKLTKEFEKTILRNQKNSSL